MTQRSSSCRATPNRALTSLAFERAGKLDEARVRYESALEGYPEYSPAIQGLASLTVKSSRKNERLAQWLDLIAARANDGVWRDWANVQRMRSR